MKTYDNLLKIGGFDELCKLSPDEKSDLRKLIKHDIHNPQDSLSDSNSVDSKVSFISEYEYLQRLGMNPDSSAFKSRDDDIIKRRHEKFVPIRLYEIAADRIKSLDQAVFSEYSQTYDDPKLPLLIKIDKHIIMPFMGFMHFIISGGQETIMPLT
ncbi:hypothetical protein GF312_04335 [Candidatus Poribacteria bacterium]|nr:hypothetical protein [Candidatus Poribacteria bacterium]